MTKILDEIVKALPKEADISEACFEGANIILYTKSKDFFINCSDTVKKIVDDIKKRIELRADPSIYLDQEKTRKIIEELVPKDAGDTNIIFDPQRSRVIIEAEKPGVAIGKQGSILRDIKNKSFWSPSVRRIPSIPSPLIENIRQVLYENNDYRKKFLNKIGKGIYDGWTRTKRNEWIRITPLGAAREVGRSCFLLQTPESNVLLDCGINIAANNNADKFPMLDAPEFDLQDLDAVIISHPHLDHVGTLPYLFKMGYRGPVYCTAPTRDVGALLCLDYIDISHKDGEDSIYSATDVKELVKHTVCLEYGEVSDITPDIRITFYNAGHNLGSSLVHMHIGNGLHNFVYTGDFNYETSNLLAPAETQFPRVESVMMESTYGSRKDQVPTRKESEELLLQLIKETADRQGKILMPVLGVGRSQEIMIILERAMREGKLPKMPIYIQGMVWDVTAIHTAYPDFFNNSVKRLIFQKDTNPFMSDVFKRVASQKEMQEVKDAKGPYIVIATSGMLTGGASLSYFKHFAENPKNTLVLTCYQGAGSLGRRLEEGDREILTTEGGSKKQESTKVLMGIYTIKGFSGHSSFEHLMQWITSVEPRPRKVINVHGEQSKCIELASNIYQTMKVETSSPKLLEGIRLK